MKKINIQTDTKLSQIIIGESLHRLANYVPPGKTIIITDDNIIKFYKDSLPSWQVITIGLGELHKTMETLTRIFDRLIELEADRSTFIVAIGGGIVCDVAGFAASVYMRGLRYGFVSTTLLSQVDASVGGKNGVNFKGYKNMLGVFNQPEFVICDLSMLKTLDKREFHSGFSEIVKAAVIQDESFFEYLECHYQEALQKKPDILEKLIYHSVLIKSRIVEKDEKEKGERKKLNFGHTFAHAIEHHTGMLHGEAVSIGMALAADLSVKMNLIQEDDCKRILRILHNFELPISSEIDFNGMIAAMKKDKKREGDYLHMVLIDHIGNAIIKKISYHELEKINYDLC
jgi:3-dehydroquinate synthase